MKITNDDNGIVIGFPYHDGRLSGVVANNSGGFDLYIKSVQGTSTQIELSNVEYFILNNFLQGNIISSMFNWRLSVAPEAIVNKLCQSIFVDKNWFLEKYGGSEMQLFVLQSSYGADLIALAECINVVNFS
jgi:hypothetical protein